MLRAKGSLTAISVIVIASPLAGTGARKQKYYYHLARGVLMDKFSDRIYSKFLLRDLLLKRLPGLLLLIGMFSVFWPRTIWRALFRRRTNLIPYVLVYGASFALGPVARFANPFRRMRF